MNKNFRFLLQVLFLLVSLIGSSCQTRGIQTRSVSAPSITVPEEEATPIPTIPPLFKDGRYNHLT
jgi:hypothetical protein